LLLYTGYTRYLVPVYPPEPPVCYPGSSPVGIRQYPGVRQVPWYPISNTIGYSGATQLRQPYLWLYVCYYNSSVDKKTGLPEIWRTCSHWWQEAGSLRARQTPARSTITWHTALLNCSPAPHQSRIGGESQEDH